MGERERLAIFNMLGEEVRGAWAIDAFAGSGALGIEALSRGAEFVLFVEKDMRAIETISGNLNNLELLDKTLVMKAKVEKVNFAPDFDVIFADPPYNRFNLKKVLNLISALKTGGILVLSHPEMEKIEISGLKLEKSRKYAGFNVDFFRKV